jgi:hypothetical protein
MRMNLDRYMKYACVLASRKVTHVNSGGGTLVQRVFAARTIARTSRRVTDDRWRVHSSSARHPSSVVEGDTRPARIASTDEGMKDEQNVTMQHERAPFSSCSSSPHSCAHSSSSVHIRSATDERLHRCALLVDRLILRQLQLQHRTHGHEPTRVRLDPLACVRAVRDE